MRTVEWSFEAHHNLDKIVSYLHEEWTEKEVKHFFERLEGQLAIILRTPDIYKKSARKKGLRECHITNHNTLFYTFDDIKIYIITVFDNRQNPELL